MGRPRQTPLLDDAADDHRMRAHDVNQLIAPSALESQSCGQLDLTPRADRAEYSACVVGETARSILEDSISVASQGKRTLRVARDREIRMIEQIVGFRSNRNLRAFPQMKALLQRQIELREPGAAQDIAPSIAELAWTWQRKGARIKPA